jgi:hypothetical protein
VSWSVALVAVFERGGIVVVLNNLPHSMERSLAEEPVQVQLAGLPAALANATLTNILFPSRDWPGGKRVSVVVDDDDDRYMAPKHKHRAQAQGS